MALHGKYRLFAFAALAMLCAAVLTGCSQNERRSLSGAVTLDGQPLAGASISFLPVTGNAGGTSGAITQDDGGFSISADKGLKQGKYLVNIQKWEGTGRTFKDPKSGRLVEITAPMKFKEAGKLDVVVAADADNRFEFNLTSAK